MLAYAFCRTMRAQNIVLLIFSLFFYAWGEPKYVVLLMLMSFVDWAAARRIQKILPKYRRARKFWVVLAAIVNLGIIGWFKYAGFLCSVFGEPPEFIANIALPIGISFYTFQLLSYVVDVSRGDAEAEKEYWHVLLYGSLYHQCIAGPIVRYKSVAEELFVHRDTWKDMPSGIVRFSVGLGKKVLLANVCGDLAGSFILTEEAIKAGATAENMAVLTSTPVAGVWLGMAAYMLQIYLDFSAYSDMAIGLGRMVGLHYVENFNYPYISTSVTEFWRRWHISLSTFFRDYVYIPLGGNREGMWKTLRNMLVVWALTGLWHGSSWNFVLWGLFFFVFLTIERLFLKGALKRHRIIGWIYTTLVVFFGWVLFRYTDLKCVGAVMRGLFGLNGNPMTSFAVKTVFKNKLYVFLFCILASTPVFRFIGRKLLAVGNGRPVLGRCCSAVVYWVVPVVLLILSTAALVGNTYNPFLYFQF